MSKYTDSRAAILWTANSNKTCYVVNKRLTNKSIKDQLLSFNKKFPISARASSCLAILLLLRTSRTKRTNYAWQSTTKNRVIISKRIVVENFVTHIFSHISPLHIFLLWLVTCTVSNSVAKYRHLNINIIIFVFVFHLPCYGTAE